MSETKFNEDDLPYLLPLYYNRIFPSTHMYRWLSYGNSNTFAKREISFTLSSEVYLRYLSFENNDEFVSELSKKLPIKFDIGAVYGVKPKFKEALKGLVPAQKEIVFDIDMTDYDDVRTCCSGTTVCSKCWTFMTIAVKILERILQDDFGFKHLLWVFSGRRGIHCWIADEKARFLSDENRGTVAEYIELALGRKFILWGNYIHPMFEESLKIIDQYFVEAIVKEQDILGTAKGLADFFTLIDRSIVQTFRDALAKETTSIDRWNAFEATFKNLFQKGQIPRNSKHLIEQIKLIYAYPRLDINVTKPINHLLKAPFSVHPKTGKISIPFNPKLVDNFDPNNVPTINLLVDEINAYDKTTIEQNVSTEDNSKAKIKDYKKTSLLKSVIVFEEFIRDLEIAEKKKHLEMDTTKEFY